MKLKGKIAILIFMLLCLMPGAGAVRTPLHSAVSLGDYAGVKRLVEKHPDWIGEKDNRGKTPLHYASKLEIAKLLVEHGAKNQINAVDMYGDTPLRFAVTCGDTAMVDYLVSQGADVNFFSGLTLDRLQKIHSIVGCYAPMTPPIIHTAILNHDLDMVKCLVRHHARIDVVDSNYNSSIHFAIRCGDMEILKYLVENGGNVNVQNGSCETPLHFAVKAGRMDMVKYLVEKNIIVNPHCIFDSALHIAARNGDRDIWDYLVAHGADINALNCQMETPLIIAHGTLQ